MFPRVSDVSHVDNYKLQLTFTDGTIAILDLGHRIAGRGGVFRALQDVSFFARVMVDREAGTLVWPNGVDFCPDVLYAEATGKSVEDLGNQLEVA